MSPTMWALIVTSLVARVDADAHAEACMTYAMGMNNPPPMTSGGEKCFPDQRRLSDLTTPGSWRRLDGHDAIMKTMCDPNCKKVVKELVEKCDGVPDMQQTVDSLGMVLGLCDDPCMDYMMKIQAAPPTTTSGASCIPKEDDKDDHDGHDHGRRLLEPFTPVSSRRLDGHTEIAGVLCEPDCKPIYEEMANLCGKNPMMSSMAMMVTALLPYCKDDCGAAHLKATQCDIGKESEKTCDQTGDCKTIVCDLKAKCEGDDKPHIVKEAEKTKPGAAKDYEDGKKKFMDAEAVCGLCTPPTTDAGTRQMLSGLATALLYAAFALQ